MTKFSVVLIAITFIISLSCAQNNTSSPPAKLLNETTKKTVPHQEKWGIYELDLKTQDARLIYSTPDEIQSSALRLNYAGDNLVFAKKIGGTSDIDNEVFTINMDGTNLKRLTENRNMDLYPAWSPDGKQVAFISKRDRDLDIYTINADGTNEKKFYDSGDHDADIDWSGNKIVFTSKFSIWTIDTNGGPLIRVTNLPDAGQWDKANLPKGDYDPRFSMDGTKIVFERLEDASTTHGSYNIFTINADGTGEKRLSDTGYSQGLASWSHSGKEIAYVVAAIGEKGYYHIYEMNADGLNNHSITPAYFPPGFLCHAPIFSIDDSKILFIGQWWE